MKLTQLAAKPQLVKFEIVDEEILSEFGEAIEFWSWDRQPLDTFMKLANGNSQDLSQMLNIVRTLILDEDGKEILSEENMLPSNVLVKVIAKIVETLGK